MIVAMKMRKKPILVPMKALPWSRRNAAVTALNRAAMTTKWLRRVANQNHQKKTLAMNPLIRQQQKKAAMPIVAAGQRLPRRLS
jgi:hypothetical protein